MTLRSILGTFAALRELHKVPALVDRVLEVERRQRAIEPSVALANRVSALEHNLDEVEALAREVNIGKPARSGGGS